MTWSRDLAYSSRKNKLHLSSYHPFILKILHASLSTPTPLATTSLSLLSYRLGYNLLYINTSSFWSRSSTRLSEPLLDCWLGRKDYLQISAFPDPVVVEQEGVPHALQESHWRSHGEVVRRRLVRRGQT